MLGNPRIQVYVILGASFALITMSLSPRELGAQPDELGTAEETFRCEIPDVDIPKREACARGAEYPDCKWRMPVPEPGGLFARWRNTTDDHLWGRPALVGLVLAVAADYREAYPTERLVVGDLDAPGPRHRTHDRGVDVDLYLPGMMEAENRGRGQYPPNYRGLPYHEVRRRRGRVERLARGLASCTAGRLRIYYNDPVVQRRFMTWFQNKGYVSDFGEAMQPHNPLHRFHFHVTIRPDQPVPPTRPDSIVGNEPAAATRVRTIETESAVERRRPRQLRGTRRSAF